MSRSDPTSAATTAACAPSYAPSQGAWEGFLPFLKGLIAEAGGRRVCEIGGGANPALSLSYIEEQGLEYTILDKSADELRKAADGYRKVEADITDASSLCQTFDVVFSKMLAEHVLDARQYHTNVRDMLVDGGVAFHFFPTLYAPPFVVNRLLPEAITARLVRFVETRDLSGIEGKFPAYYRWCRGPTARQIRRLQSVGYTVVDYRGFFGTRGYYDRLGMGWLDDWMSRRLLAHPVPLLTSYAYVVLRRSAGGDRRQRRPPPASGGGDPVVSAHEAVRRRRVPAVVVDAEDGHGRLGLARELATAMGARYLSVPELSSGALGAAIQGALRTQDP